MQCFDFRRTFSRIAVDSVKLFPEFPQCVFVSLPVFMCFHQVFMCFQMFDVCFRCSSVFKCSCVFKMSYVFSNVHVFSGVQVEHLLLMSCVTLRPCVAFILTPCCLLSQFLSRQVCCAKFVFVVPSFVYFCDFMVCVSMQEA